jgi:hypothetical protein
MMNENFLANLTNDIKFIQEQLDDIGRGALSIAFLELERVGFLFERYSLSNKSLDPKHRAVEQGRRLPQPSHPTT